VLQQAVHSVILGKGLSINVCSCAVLSQHTIGTLSRDEAVDKNLMLMGLFMETLRTGCIALGDKCVPA
jgi:hypothetical protein